jgi:serine O-acetyltransferase
VGGTGAVILEGLRIGDRTRIGAGAVVLGDVDVDATVVGVPVQAVAC